MYKFCNKCKKMFDMKMFYVNSCICVSCEKKRNREKYVRLNYKNRKQKNKKNVINTYYNKFPEKRISHLLSNKIKKKGYEKHHWSYDVKNFNKVVFLKTKDHSKLHRFIIYDQERCMYRNLRGILLDSVEKTCDLLIKLNISDYEINFM